MWSKPPDELSALCLGSLSNVVKYGCATCFGEHKPGAKSVVWYILPDSIQANQKPAGILQTNHISMVSQGDLTSRTIRETLGKHDIKNLHSDRVEFFWSEGAVCFFFSQGLSVGLPLARSWIYRISTPEPGICFLNADNLFLGVVVFVDSWPNEEVDETCGERNKQTA